MPTTFKDYYAVLGVARTATEKEIHSAFRKLARRHHPDVNQGDKSAEARFKEINEAHEVLGDPEKRRKYDELGPRWQEYEAWERAGKPGPDPFAAGGPQPQFEYRTVSPDEMETMFGGSGGFSDFFETFFGGSGGRGSSPRAGTRGRSRPAARGGDVEAEAEITLEEAARGTTRTVEIAAAGGQARRVELRVPPGIREGARIRAAGQGGAGTGGGPGGDLFVRVRIRPDPRFTRNGDDLTVRVPVPLAVAILGGPVSVPTPRGTQVELTIPAETQNGAKLRLRGQGMPRLRGEGAGDLTALVDVRLPVPVPADLRQAVEALRAGLPG